MNFLTVIVFVACFAALRPSGTTPRRLEFLTEIVVVGMRHVPFERYDCPYENTGQTYFRVGCNMCECNRGDLVNCTKYRCSPDGSIAPAPEVECVDFEVKWDDCSVCFCRNETWRCVPKPCNKAKNKRSISESFCFFDGMRKYEECNECVCKSARWSCAENTCVAPRGAPHYVSFFEDELKDVACAPGDKLVIDCNVCHCNQNSVGYLCERVEDCRDDHSLELRIRSVKKYIRAIMEGK
jgi:hypothetical protein